MNVEDFIFGEPPREEHLTGLTIEGVLPAYVTGTYYLNGPAKFKTGSLSRNHWLDGDGMVRALSMAGGKADYRSRYVQTTRYREEQEAETPLYRSFGTAFDGDKLRKHLTLESPANVSAYRYGDRLLAFGEQSLPWALDPVTLETSGEFDFGRFRPVTPLAAHGKTDPNTGEMFSFGIMFFGRRGKLFFHGFTPDLQPTVKGSASLPEGSYIHDFNLSQNYACFHLAPYSLDVHQFVKNTLSLMDALTWHPDKPFELRIFCRKSGEQVAALPLARKSFCLHVINTYEDGTDLIIDLVDTPEPFFDRYYARPLMFENLKPCATIRFIVDTQTWTLRETRVYESELHFDFPSIGAANYTTRYKHFWAAGMAADPVPCPKFYNRLFRFDWDSGSYADSWQAGEKQVVGGEPLFIPDPAREKQGVVMCQTFCLESEKSGYLFFDAFNLAAGPIASLSLPFYDPLGFHTSWKPAEAQGSL